MKAGRASLGLALLAVGGALLFLFGLTSGSERIPWGQCLAVLFGRHAADPVWDDILRQIRLPRCLAAWLGGACLALSGLELQTLFRNPLAGPFSLGISSGATLGVALAVAGTVGGVLPAWLAAGGLWAQLGMAGSAVIGSLAVMLLVLAVARRVRGNATLLILGLMFGQVASALVSVLQAFGTSEQIRAFTFWSFGSYAGVTWAQMPVLAGALVVGALLAAPCAKHLNALLLGWEYARSLGVPVQTLRLLLLFSASLLSGAVTAFCGPIAFLGLAVPHIARGLFRTADHRILLPACAVLGGAISLAADLASRLPGTGRALPLNAVMALVGAPVVIGVLLRRNSNSERARE